MKILIAYASKYGSTKGITEFIGEKLRQHGMEAVAKDVGDIKDADLQGSDAFVIGSAAYMGTWLKQARQFVEQNKSQLAGKPVWLFSSGPVGSEKTDKKGRDVLKLSEPKEFADFGALLKPKGLKVFFGSLYAEKLTGLAGFGYRLAQKMPAAKAAMPDGDFRDWKEIEAWTDSIAAAVK
ncbi:MAG: flavodoxin domain-containing protein [Candidatus Saccharibacteria bacterium]